MSADRPGYCGPELCALSACRAVELLEAGEVSPAELLEASLERIAQTQGAVNATVILCPERARRSIGDLPALRARHGAAAGWLGGLPLSIKDLNHVKGVRTTFGSLAMRDFVAAESDPLVERLEERGGLIVGKSNTPEFGAGGNTFNAVFGYTRNPWDTRRNAGGSSGGAAAALAVGEVWLAQGSDLAGSLRTPAAMCGVVGMRPSPGRCGGGPQETGFSIDAIAGPMARTVADLALLLDAMTGFDPRMPLSLEAPALSFRAAAARAAGKVRIAFSEDQGGFAPVEAGIRAVMRAAMERCARAGALVEEAVPELPGLADSYRTLRAVHYGAVNAYLPQAVQDAAKRTLKENIAFARGLEAAAIYESMRQRSHLYHIMRRFLADFDALALPVVGLEPGPVEEEYPRFVDGQPQSDYVDWLRFSFLATATALPAISVPVGLTAGGMPVGIQLVGSPRGEARLLQVARFVEESVDFPARPIDPVVRHGGRPQPAARP